jgi:hypothetical protein
MDFEQYSTAVRTVFTSIATTAQAYVPSLLGALALLLVGWLLAWALGGWVARLLRRLDRFLRDSQFESALRRIGIERPFAAATGRLVFWVVLLFFFAAATEALGLPVLTAWLTGFAYFVPRIAVAVLVLLVGLLAAGLVRNAVLAATATAHLSYGDALAEVARVVTIIVAALIAVNELGLDVTILTVALTVVLGSILGGFALAFGLGARTAVSNIVGSHYLRQIAQVGQTIRLGTLQGEIVAITPTAVVLKSTEGRVVVPAKEFSEAISMLLTTGR